MNTTGDQPWSSDEPLNNIVTQEMDFTNLLDLDDIDVSGFQLPDQPASDVAAHFHTPQQQSAPFDGQISGLHPSTVAHDFGHEAWNMAMDMDNADMIAGHAANTAQDNMQPFPQQMAHQVWNGGHHRQQPHVNGHMANTVYRHPNQVPPTPNSYDLHGGDPAHFDEHMARQHRAFLDQQMQHQLQLHQNKRDTYTPLVSPAMTPQEPSFPHHPEYAVPGAYFSPLTSPALQAQNAAQHGRRAPGTQPGTGVTSAATSPVPNDSDIDMFSAENAQPVDRTRKGTRKAQVTRSVGSKSAVRQSPVTKPQKRKSTALSSALSSQDLENLFHNQQNQQGQNLRAAASSTDSSGHGSISPEPLSDAVMGPPPRPGSGSTTQSPTIFARHHYQDPQARLKNGAAPATPASLMSIDNPRHANHAKGSVTGSGRTTPSANLDNHALEDFSLPPSVANNTSANGSPLLDSGTTTPRIIASRKTPKLNPISIASAGRSSVGNSPAISAMVSPQSATTPNFAKDARNRSSKKRGSVSQGSTTASPALRPKISPSIKPLLPDGANLSDRQQAYLLASKSNYTHLLEGTLIPGVSYPDSLSTGLTSKRTSHKIAEQGRRNRINEALKEMQALLPPPALRAKSCSASNGDEKSDDHDSPDANGESLRDDEPDPGKSDDGKSKSKDKNGKTKDSPRTASAASEAKAANSKAATVEHAIDYIRTLQKERLVMSEAIKAKDNEVNELRKRLRDAEFKLGTPSLDVCDATSPRSTSPSTAETGAADK